ncbi:MAG TPA: tRNA-dihydrouridine synthase [Deltaproteobacteria bacterium]|jgi:nifR3 family TIM-barrel protein|nr:tRNA-dihydrouridine synthase [Deltaproteobacteria bacterium]HOI08140.1 tRNA-dihydrouridine synthase [Deltaproteobacteria bacterium]
MKLYNVTLTNGLLLAPMSGYTNWPMRVLSRRFGAELCYTEMISSAGLIMNTRNTRPLLKRPPEDAPLIAQIFTASPEEAALSARIIEDAGFDGIDINMGCPVKKVVHKGAGAALMRDVDLARRLCQAVRDAVSIPVSAKIRAGWDHDSINAGELAAALQETGIDCLAIHPRTRSDMYRGTPMWDLFASLKGQLSLPVIASGNIHERQDIRRLSSLGADAFMVGRAAVGNPWIFRELTGGPAPTVEERREAMLEHLDMLCSLIGVERGIRFMRKYVSAYVRGLHGAARFRQQACTTDGLQQLRNVIKGFVNGPPLC